MTIMPGSLDYLYYNGILDHIPYEAYETCLPYRTPINYSYSNPYLCKDMYCSQYPEENKQSRGWNITKKILTSNIFKGLLGAGVIIGTFACLLKGKGKQAKTAIEKSSFWKKLNPKNWFKKD